jgi:hypothetical protein
MIRPIVAVFVAAGMMACNDPDIVEPLPITYAVVSGVVYSAAGGTVGNATVFVSCGVSGPSTLATMVTTNSVGSFRAEMAGYLPPPTPGKLRCRVSTPGNGPAVGTTYFEAELRAGSPVETNVDVREGVVQQLPGGWTS